MDDEKKGLFPPPVPPMPADDKSNEVFARLRVDEQRAGELRKKLLFLEQNILSNHRSAMDNIKSLQRDIVDCKRNIQEIEDKILTIIKEIRLVARKEDVDVLRKYIDLWDPVKFVTLDQVERMINEKIGLPVEEVRIIEPEFSEKSEELEEPEEAEADGEDESGGQEEKQPGDESLQETFESLIKRHEKGNV